MFKCKTSFALLYEQDICYIILKIFDGQISKNKITKPLKSSAR